MGTIITPSETMKRAVRWISEERRQRPGAKLFELVSEAGRRFDLAPSEEEGLFTFLKSGDVPKAPEAEAPKGPADQPKR
jgi:hypothetical protein